MSIHIPAKSYAAASASAQPAKRDQPNLSASLDVASFAAAGFAAIKNERENDSSDEVQLLLKKNELDKKKISELSAKNLETTSSIRKVEEQMRKMQEQVDDSKWQIKERTREIEKIDLKVRLRGQLVNALNNPIESSNPHKRKSHKESVRNPSSHPHHSSREAEKERSDKRQRVHHSGPSPTNSASVSASLEPSALLR